MIRIMNTKRIAFISSFRPRKCGIATFTSDLIDNIGKAGGIEFIPSVVAMETNYDHRYTKPVEFVIRKDFAADYTDAANYINSGNFDFLSLQHEFGLYGAEGGSHINLLLRRLNIPIVTTLHTVLEKPSSEYFNALTDVCGESDIVIVMNERGIGMLTDIYGVPKRKIKLIPHGIPDVSFNHRGLHKRNLGFSNRKVILTFGLIGRNKGIEVMLRAMPNIIKTHPETLYIVLGATHPEVVKHEGYSYRNELLQIVKDLEIQNHVMFHDRYVTDMELQQFLSSADVYVTPYLYKEQLTSGTLAFAVGSGKAVVSTPYWAAEELLAQGRGVLVEFNNPKQIASAITKLLDDEVLLKQMQLKAYQYGRAMTWTNVGRAYWNLFEKENQPVSTMTKEAVSINDNNVTQLQLARCVKNNTNHSILLTG
jgi:glycosyltransferase involved in cell wall biosynthesis